MKKTLREWRHARGYTAEFVAEQIGLSKYTLNQKEIGRRDFSNLQTRLLCNLYQISFDDIVPVFLAKSASKMRQRGLHNANPSNIL